VKTTFKVLTAKPGQAHRETEVTIDWTGMTEEKLLTLAKWALVADMQARFVKGDLPIPAKHDIVAAEGFHAEPPAMMKYMAQPKKSNLDLILEKMSPEEREEALLLLRQIPME